jgi:hypothetical protein
MIFLTDGTTFIGPYKPGDPAIARQAWRRAERKAVPAG